SLKTDSEKRDAHLNSADYIDSAKFATATVDVDNVKKKDGQSYTADAKIKFRDLEQKYPVTFEVVETKDDSIRIRGEHKFPRLDFKVGKAEGDGVAPDLTAKIQLTLKKS
ncbi:MAG: YceI family protein, partial [Kofleriaceae bacterium]